MTEESADYTARPETESFQANYKVLREVSEKLRRQSTSDEMPDIDQLVPDVERATKAYQACEARLKAVEQALAEKLPQEEGEAGASNGAQSSPDPTQDGDDDHIPF